MVMVSQDHVNELSTTITVVFANDNRVYNVNTQFGIRQDHKRSLHEHHGTNLKFLSEAGDSYRSWSSDK